MASVIDTPVADPLIQDLRRRRKAGAVHAALFALLLVTALASLTVGATGVSLGGAVWDFMVGRQIGVLEATVLWDIRAPRTIMGILVGAALAVSGAVMQGLFRNPLADPGLLGVSAGASLGAVGAIVLGVWLPAAVVGFFGFALLPLAAFLGAWVVMLTLYGLATRRGRTSVGTMLLGGIGISALAGALNGLMVFIADDLQLRELTFWGLGSLTGATWAKTVVAGPVILVSTLAAMSLAQGLNSLSVGEATARHIGVDVQTLKRWAILSVAAATGAAVAVSGGIGFIGIVVPHLLRLATGADHRRLLLNAALLGASLLLGADMISRVIVAPTELPIGIVTAVLGAPVFLWILLRQRGVVDI